MIYFSADCHFGHANIIRLCDRPFTSVGHMDHTLISNWNSVVNNGDTVYHLGDFSFGSVEYTRKIKQQLNGTIHFIRGNHDWKNAEALGDMPDIYEMKIGKQHIVMCHYPMRSWNKSFHGSWHIYGHTHGKLPPFHKSYDVGVDNNDYTPISFTKLSEIISTLYK